ncbi:SdpA family antimicrobial peptide system protein [Arthrobacter sp. CP30]
MPSNVLSVRDGGPVRTFFGTLMPQSWSFFTKPPDSPELTAYVVQSADQTLANASEFPNSRPENLFGFARDHRSQGPEMALLSFSDAEWLECADLVATDDCLVEAFESLPVTPVANSSPDPTICGEVLLVETAPVPWTYRAEYTGWRIDERVSHLEVTC